MIPINDLNRHISPIKDEIKEVINNLLSRGCFVLGPEVDAFENKFASYCGVDFCVSVANGTDALEIALRALGVSKGDKVSNLRNQGNFFLNEELIKSYLYVCSKD